MVLDEHYRCHPHIARWSNRVFYSGSLTVLTDVARMPSNERRIGWLDVRGEVHRGGAGSWTNMTEAEVAVHQIAAMVRHAGRSDEQNFVRAAAVGCITVPSGTGKMEIPA